MTSRTVTGLVKGDVEHIAKVHPGRGHVLDDRLRDIYDCEI